MGDGEYEIVFRGKLVAGVEAGTAQRNVAQLFKLDSAKAGVLFDGTRRVLKKGLDRATADKYREALRRAGAVVAVVSSRELATAAKFEPPERPSAPSDGARAVFVVDDPSKAAEPAAQAQPEVAGPTEGAAAQVADEMLAPPGMTLVEPTVAPPFEIDLSAFELAETGVVMDQSERPAAMDIDVGELSAVEDYTRLDERPPPPPPQIDTTALAVDEASDALDQKPPPAPAQIDTSALEVKDDYDALDSSARPQAPAIDTSQLSLDDQ